MLRFYRNPKIKTTMQDLRQFDILPSGLRAYLAQYGHHFSKPLCDYAVSLMQKAGPDGKPVAITPMSREEVDTLLKTHGVELKNNVLYDHVFVANMVKSDQLGSSIVDAKHHALAIKDYIDDIDKAEGYLFDRWMSDLCGLGPKYIPYWEDMI
jgi:hypothetical protein